MSNGRQSPGNGDPPGNGEPAKTASLEVGSGSEGDLTVRLGHDGESYAGIRKDVVNVAGRICVADARGPCGSPSADSERTMITTATERAAWIFFLPVEERDLRWTYELVARFGRGLVRVA